MISFDEITALSGLPHIQQLTYLLGLRPYVDYKTGLVGIKRGVSYQSISEALYVEPHPGIISGRPSKAQLRRALKGLEKAGILSIQSLDKKLIVQCNLVTLGYSAQNKVVTNPSHESVISKQATSLSGTGEQGNDNINPVPPKTTQPVTPLRDNNFNNNTLVQSAGDVHFKQPISPTFQPNQETLSRAIASGHANAADPHIIQEFIDKNTAWGSEFADFNPIYLSFLAKHAEREEQKSMKNNRSNNHERTSNKRPSYDAIVKQVERDSPYTYEPSAEDLYASEAFSTEIECESYCMGMDGINQSVWPIVSNEIRQ